MQRLQPPIGSVLLALALAGCSADQDPRLDVVRVDRNTPDESPPEDSNPDLPDAVSVMDVVDAQVVDVIVPVDTQPPPDRVVPDVVADVVPDGGCAFPWPTCDVRPTRAMASSIEQLWMAEPIRPTFVWVSGAIVTGITRGRCSAGFACQIFLQEPNGASTLAQAAHHAIKLFISAGAASRFTSISVGDRVDVAAYAWRYNFNGQNELLLQAAESCSLQGCAQRTGTGNVNPVPATLDQLGSVDAYERTFGPVVVQLTGVSATTDPATPLESTTGGLFVPRMGFDAGATQPVSVSPYLLPDGRFVRYTPMQRLNFASLTGIFAMFSPNSPDAGMVPKYLLIEPRTTAELMVQ